MCGHVINTERKKRYIMTPSSIDSEDRKYIKYKIKKSIKSTVDDLVMILENSNDKELIRFINREVLRVVGNTVDGDSSDDADEKSETEIYEEQFWSGKIKL